MTAELGNLTVTALLEALASAAPAPGGGAACALSGALSAALVSMVANLTLTKVAAEPELQTTLAQAEDLRQRLVALMAADARAYDQVIAAYRLPRVTTDDKAARRAAIEAALQEATYVPLEIATCCAEALTLAEPAARLGSRAAVTDAGAAAYLAEAAARAALLNVEVNLGSIHDQAFAAWAQGRATALVAALPGAREAALTAMHTALAAPAKKG